MLFYPIIGKKLNFKDFVIENSSKVHHVSELLAMSNMGKSQFHKRYSDRFGIQFASSIYRLLQEAFRIYTKAARRCFSRRKQAIRTTIAGN